MLRGERTRGSRAAGALVAAGLLAALALTARPAAAQAYGERSAFNASDCNRACLIEFAKQYMDGLVRHDPSHVPFAAGVKFTENDVVIRIGSGLWGSISAASPDPLLAADPDTGNVAWFGTVEEHGVPAYYAMRLKVSGGRIIEVETVVDRKTDLPAPFGDPTKASHDPAFSEVLPPALRRERERLRDVANGYFSTVERNDGDLLTLFDPDCQRMENGISTTRGSYGSAALAQGCEAQFKLGAFRINKRVRERRYPLIDVQRGVVVATGFFDHDNSFDRYTTTDGKERRTLLKWPNSLSLMEAFKIRGGKIYRVEAVFTYVPYFMHSPWAGAAAATAADAVPASGAEAESCDRACLIGFADRYMAALVAHDPSSLPWAKIVRYTENSVPMNVGEGEWETVTGTSKDPIEVADPATGDVAWLGAVAEHGDPAYLGLRLKVQDRRISEVEVVMDPERGSGPLGDPALHLRDPVFNRALPAGDRASRARLIAVAVSSLEAAGALRGDHLRDPRFSAVDVERGVVVATAFVDHAARSGGGTPYPESLGLIEALKVSGGRVARVETIYAALPYAMPSPWVERTAARDGPAAVDEERLANADEDPGQWMSYGRTWSEQRFSPLAEINDRNVRRLALAWYADLNTYRGVDATPLEIDGILYNVSAWDVTTAYDAATGKVLWTYDPKVPLEWGRLACCGPVSRGLAAWKGKIFVAALDGRLIALDAKTGKPVWVAQTLEQGEPLSVTGAPRVADGQVVIGNGGGDFGARGYISAYDAQTGRQTWKFYIVPGDPAKGPDGAASDSVMPMAARTWTGQWWKVGGGGNDWDTIVYDPKLNLVYFGTGNGSPHPEAFRSPGGGDNLFLCSIVAVDASTGRYVWHYQEIPGEEWDYDCTAPLMLADLTIAGRVRRVILHAPKDGFFYVLDRETGKLISAQPYVPNTWASRIDMRTGRPVVYPDADVAVKPHLQTPSSGGGHNWNPMAFSPLTGLVYIPTMEQWMIVSRLPDGQFKFKLGQTTLGAGYGNYPELRKKLNREAEERDKGYLLAWDPVHQREAFRIPYPHPGNGGTLVTAGNLLIEGTIDNTLAIYRADNGRKLWEMPVQSVPVAGPISYALNGKQYIAVNAGWNNAIVHGLTKGDQPFSVGPARLLVFTLDVNGVALPPAPPTAAIPPPPAAEEPVREVEAGEGLYSTHCAVCHGQNAVGSGAKDLRHLGPQAHAAFDDIVLAGTLQKAGMASFKGVLTKEQVDAIHAFVIARAQEDWQPDFLHPPKRK